MNSGVARGAFKQPRAPSVCYPSLQSGLSDDARPKKKKKNCVVTISEMCLLDWIRGATLSLEVVLTDK